MARSPLKVASENDVTPPAEETLDFDEDNLKAIGEVYKNQGNEEYRRKDFINAIHFYTEGVKVKCKDDNLKAQLYSNRAIANFKLGNYHDSLSDAKSAIELQPSFLKAIVRGASACVALKRFEEAITWCNKGLAIDKNNKTLLGLKSKSVNEQKNVPETPSLKCKDGDTKEVTLADQKNAVNESEDTAPVAKALKHNDDHLRGNYESSLRDARAATDLQPTFLKAIERGATACMKLSRFEEAITWCNKGLAIDKNNKKLLELRIKSVKEQNKQQTPDGEIAQKNIKSHSVKGMVGDTKCPNAKGVCDLARQEGFHGNLGSAFLNLGDFSAIDYYELDLKIAKEVGDKVGEGNAYGNLGNALLTLGDFKKAIDYYELHLKIAKEVGDKAGEGRAYGNLGIAFSNLSDFRKAIDLYELQLKTAKEVGDKDGEVSKHLLDHVNKLPSWLLLKWLVRHWTGLDWTRWQQQIHPLS